MGDQSQKREETGAMEVDILLTAKSPSRRSVGRCFKYWINHIPTHTQAYKATGHCYLKGNNHDFMQLASPRQRCILESIRQESLCPKTNAIRHHLCL